MKHFFATYAQQLITLFGAMLVPAVTLFVFWAKERGRLTRRRQLLDEAAARLKFLNDWQAEIRSRRTLTGIESTLCDVESKRLSRVTRDLYLHWPAPETWTPDAYRAYLTEVSVLRRILLLYTQRSPEVAQEAEVLKMALWALLYTMSLVTWYGWKLNLPTRSHFFVNTYVVVFSGGWLLVLYCLIHRFGMWGKERAWLEKKGT